MIIWVTLELRRSDPVAKVYYSVVDVSAMLDLEEHC